MYIHRSVASKELSALGSGVIQPWAISLWEIISVCVVFGVDLFLDHSTTPVHTLLGASCHTLVTRLSKKTVRVRRVKLFKGTSTHHQASKFGPNTMELFTHLRILVTWSLTGNGVILVVVTRLSPVTIVTFSGLNRCIYGT